MSHTVLKATSPSVLQPCWSLGVCRNTRFLSLPGCCTLSPFPGLFLPLSSQAFCFCAWLYFSHSSGPGLNTTSSMRPSLNTSRSTSFHSAGLHPCIQLATSSDLWQLSVTEVWVYLLSHCLTHRIGWQRLHNSKW